MLQKHKKRKVVYEVSYWVLITSLKKMYLEEHRKLSWTSSFMKNIYEKAKWRRTHKASWENFLVFNFSASFFVGVFVQNWKE